MSRPTTLTGPWLALSKKFKSIEALATALGVKPRTIRRWHLGERTPHPIVKNKIDAVAEEYGITLTWKTRS
jgi:transcriptional regulator with XRE-family HTH domain